MTPTPRPASTAAEPGADVLSVGILRRMRENGPPVIVAVCDSHEALRAENARLRTALAEAGRDTERLTKERDAAWAANERDRTGYARFVTSIRAWASRWGMATSRGSYEWDDDEYRKEFQRAIAEIQKIADRLERNAHATDLRDCPTTQEQVVAARASRPASPEGQ